MFGDQSVSDTSESENEGEEIIVPRPFLEMQALYNLSTHLDTIVRPLSERQSGQRIFYFTLHALLKNGTVKSFPFSFDKRPVIPRNTFTEDSSSLPFHSTSTDNRISSSFRTTRGRNVKVLITKGGYKAKHGVIVKSYVLKKNLHRVLTSDGSVITVKQLHLARLDYHFWLPYGIPVESV